MTSDEELRKKAEKIAEEKASFYIHISAYIMVNTMFIILWLYSTGPRSFPWWIFITLGWGIGVVAHFVEAFVVHDLKEKMAEKEFQKLKGGR